MKQFMKKSWLPQIAEDILQHPTWIVPYTSPNIVPNNRATIKHLHWAMPKVITVDNNTFIHAQQANNARPHVIADIPWDEKHPRLLTYLRSINDERRTLQHFLQSLQLTVPISNLNIHIPINNDLLTINPMYPKDYMIKPTKSKLFYIYHTTTGNTHIPLPNRIPQSVVHAVQRLYTHNAIPDNNRTHVARQQHTPDLSIVAPLPSFKQLSQHEIVERIKRWTHYYPDIPVPGYTNVHPL